MLCAVTFICIAKRDKIRRLSLPSPPPPLLPPPYMHVFGSGIYRNRLTSYDWFCSCSVCTLQGVRFAFNRFVFLHNIHGRKLMCFAFTSRSSLCAHMHAIKTRETISQHFQLCFFFFFAFLSFSKIISISVTCVEILCFVWMASWKSILLCLATGFDRSLHLACALRLCATLHPLLISWACNAVWKFLNSASMASFILFYYYYYFFRDSCVLT